MKSKERIRIAHVSWRLDVGGLEQLLVDFARHADRDCFDLQFISLNGRGKLADDLEAMGSTVTVLEPGSQPRMAGIAHLAEIFTGSGVQIVHTHNRGPLIHAAPAARLAGASVIHTRHGRRSAPTFRQQTLYRAASHLVERFVCVSSDCAMVTARESLCPQRVMVIRNGIDLDRFKYSGPQARGPVVVVARLSPQKDLQTLIQAVALASRDEPRLRLQIAGEGPSRRELEKLIDDLRLQQHVQLLGMVQDVPRLLESASMFVLSSLHEGLPLSILEAMAVGLPVVATRVGGIPELVAHGETGLLVNPGDSRALAEAMLSLIADPITAQALGSTGRLRVETHFDVKQMMAQYENIYRALVFPRDAPVCLTKRAC